MQRHPPRLLGLHRLRCSRRTIRARRPVWLPSAVVSAVILAACTGGGSDASPSSTTVPRQDLYGAQVSALDGEVWVFGGHAAPEGTAPPVTSILPPGWEPNLSVVAYSPTGEVTRRHRLPDGMDAAVIFGDVLLDDGVHHLLGTLCKLAAGCANDVEPVLFRLDEHGATRIEVDMPPAPVIDQAGIGVLTTLGASDGTAWALQLVTSNGSGYAGYADRHRLLGIDLTDGGVTEVELPTDVYGEQFFCMSGSDLFAAQATIDEDSNLSEVRIMKRAATTTAAAWEPFVVLPLEPHLVYTGSLSCIDPLDELLLTLEGTPAEVFTFDTTTGRPTTPAGTLPGDLLQMLGVVDGTAIALAQLEGDELGLWRHPRGAPWEADRSVRLTHPVDLLVLDGRLLDVSDVRKAIGPGSMPLTEVEL